MVVTGTLVDGGVITQQAVATPSTPAAGNGLHFVDSADGLLKYRSSAGTVYDLTAAGGTIAIESGGTGSNLSATGPGTVQQRTAGADLDIRIDNYTSSTNPTANDDTGDGYEIGSLWFNITNDRAYIAADVTSGAAVWIELGAGVTSHNLLNDLTTGDDHTQYVFQSPASSARNVIQPTDDYHAMVIKANAAQSSESLFVLETSGGAPILEMDHEGGLSGNQLQNASGNFSWDGANFTNVLRVRASTDAVGIGIALPTAKLHIDQSDATGAKPVLKLNQGDVSEEFIYFRGESTTDASQSLIDAADLTTPGSILCWVRIYIEDTQVTNPISSGIGWFPVYTEPTA